VIAAAARRALGRSLGDRVRFDVPLARHVSLRVGGQVDALVTPTSRGELARTLAVCAEHELPMTLLGAGFNTLPLDGGLAGVAIRTSRLRGLELRPEGSLRAEAGVSHNSLVKQCVSAGRSGLEFGAGIPGTVGGWIAMNAGIGEREVKDVVREIEVMRPDGSAVDAVPRAKLDFQYRVLQGLEPGSVVVAAVFETSASTPQAVQAEIDRLLEKRSATQPLDVPSCGSVFKNPPDDHAGRLVEAAGLKGASEGGARISERHANFIVNTGGATAADVVALIERAREAVRRSSGIDLETEVRIVGSTS